MSNLLSTQEVREIFKHIITTSQSLAEEGKGRISAELVGPAGLGKTSVIGQIAKELGMGFVKKNLSTLEDLSDLIGFPIKEFLMKSPEFIISNVGGVPTKIANPIQETIWVDDQTMPQYLKLNYTATGEKRTSYCKPEWLSGVEGPHILLLDDYSRSQIKFQQACMEIIDQGEFYSWKLPSDWVVLLTSNPDNGNYLVNTPDDPAMKSRYFSFEIGWDKDSWAEWAENTGIDGRCISFMLHSGDELFSHDKAEENGVNPRSLVKFFNAISKLPDFSKSLHIVQMLGAASIGEVATQLFTAFINNRLDKLPSVDDMINTKKDFAIIKQSLVDVVRKDGNYRADIASVLCTRLRYGVLAKVAERSADDKLVQRLVDIFTDSEIFNNDVAYMVIKAYINSDKPSLSSKIAQHPDLRSVALQ